MKKLLILLLLTSIFAFTPSKTEKYGVTNGKTNHFMTLDNVKELAVMFSVGGGHLQNISYYLGQWQYEDRAIKLKVQLTDENGFPGKLIAESPVFNPSPISKPQWSKFIFENAPLVEKQNFFVVIEIISNDPTPPTAEEIMVAPVKATIGTVSNDVGKRVFQVRILEKQRLYQEWREIETIPMIGVEFTL